MRALTLSVAAAILAAAVTACGGGGGGGGGFIPSSSSGTTATSTAEVPSTPTASTPSTGQASTSPTPSTGTPADAGPEPQPQTDPNTNTSTPFAPNSVRLESDQGDFVGAGKTYEYSSANSILTVTSAGNRLSVRTVGDQTWTGEFVLPSSATRLQTGTYSNLDRYPFHNPIFGGLSWFGDGRGCNTLRGSFTISSVTYVADVLKAVELSFEQHCEGVAVALRGQIHWTAYDKTVAPGPVNPPPAGLWEPAAGSTPATGNYIYLVSDQADFIGSGSSYLFTPDTTPMSATVSGGRLTVNGGFGVSFWTGEFMTMNSLTKFEPGYYGGLNRYPFHNPATGGLSWTGWGRGCNTLRGWFAVDQVRYEGTTLKSIDLRFEQHCEGLAPALRGKVHMVF
ncbi:hypothetical protein J7E62_05520 [Variovorax paradoxus]|nr:hypothetical protein [Variovorax paradoxus]